MRKPHSPAQLANLTKGNAKALQALGVQPLPLGKISIKIRIVTTPENLERIKQLTPLERGLKLEKA
jgi:hypothetical protein